MKQTEPDNKQQQKHARTRLQTLILYNNLLNTPPSPRIRTPDGAQSEIEAEELHRTLSKNMNRNLRTTRILSWLLYQKPVLSPPTKT